MPFATLPVGDLRASSRGKEALSKEGTGIFHYVSAASSPFHAGNGLKVDPPCCPKQRDERHEHDDEDAEVHG